MQPREDAGATGEEAGMPRWVKVSGLAVGIAIAVVILVVLLTGGGGGHGPGRHGPDGSGSPVEQVAESAPGVAAAAR